MSRTYLSGECGDRSRRQADIVVSQRVVVRAGGQRKWQREKGGGSGGDTEVLQGEVRTGWYRDGTCFEPLRATRRLRAYWTDDREGRVSARERWRGSALIIYHWVGYGCDGRSSGRWVCGGRGRWCRGDTRF